MLEAFVAAGYLTPEEANERPSARPSLAELSDDDLLGEVRRRMQGGQSWGDGEPSGPEDEGGGPSAAEQKESPRTEAPTDHADGIVLHLRAGEDIPAELLDKLAAYVPGVEPGLRIPEQEQAGEENQDPGDDG